MPELAQPPEPARLAACDPPCVWFFPLPGMLADLPTAHDLPGDAPPSYSANLAATKYKRFSLWGIVKHSPSSDRGPPQPPPQWKNWSLPSAEMALDRSWFQEYKSSYAAITVRDPLVPAGWAYGTIMLEHVWQCQ